MNFTDKRFSFALGEHHDKKVIWIRFQKDRELINFLKNNTTKPQWSVTNKAWYLSDNKHYRQLFCLTKKKA